jgi:hypothetical protein
MANPNEKLEFKRLLPEYKKSRLQSKASNNSLQLKITVRMGEKICDLKFQI